MKHIAKLLLVWLALSALCYAIATMAYPTDVDFQEHMAMTTGTITGIYPDNHSAISFDYFVNGEKYSAIGGTTYGFPPIDKLHPGQQIEVYYDTRNPGIARSTDPGLEHQQNQTQIGFITLAGPIFLLIMLVRSKMI